MSEQMLKKIAEAVGGKVEEVGGPLPDGSCFAVISIPLPTDHWLYADHENAPPRPFRMGKDDPRRKEWEEKIQAAGRYAIRAATMNGRDNDFDPDALVQNLIVGMLGEWTPDGLPRA